MTESLFKSPAQVESFLRDRMNPTEPSAGLPLRVDAANVQVWQGQRLLKLTPKSFAVLHYLNQHAGQLVTKAALMGSVWADTTVTDGALAACIRELRKALHDDVRFPQYIETMHRHGYRLIIAATAAVPLVSDSGFQLAQATATGRAGQRGPWQEERATVLVERDTQLAFLHTLFAKVLAGARQCVFVTGESGIGKTALLDVFQQATMTDSYPQPTAPWVGRGQCIEHYGAGEAYLPVLEALGRLCRGPGGERLIGLLRHHAPMWLLQMPALLNSTDYDALQRMTQGLTRERMLREFAEALDVITAERPFILVLEDLHWSDSSTLDLLSILARRPEPARLLVMGTYRPIDVIVREHALKTVKEELHLHEHCQELALELLSEPAIAAYLMGRFGGLSSPRGAASPEQRRTSQEGDCPAAWQGLAHLIYQSTEGNPLFMVAMVDDLVARGLIVQTATAWELQAEATAIAERIPDSIRQLVTLQRGRLLPEEQQTLEAASIAGLTFSAASVAAALVTETGEVERQCQQLADRHYFLRRVGIEDWPDGTLAARYMFSHAVYQQLWHEGVSPTQLQHYHRHIGERKERAYGERAREIAVELALHFEQGRDYTKAVQALQQAAQNAFSRHALNEVITHASTGPTGFRTRPSGPNKNSSYRCCWVLPC